MLELAPTVVALLAVTATYKVLTLVRGFIAPQAALAAVFVALTLGVLPFAGLHTSALGDTAAVRGWGDVFARAFVAIAAGLAQTYLLLLALPVPDAARGARPRLIAAACVATGMVVFGGVTPTDAFGTAPLDGWPELAMHALFLLYVAVALGDIAGSALRWARSSTGGMRVGLLLVSGGAASAIVYAVVKGVSVATEGLGVAPSPWLVESARAAALLGLVMVSAGCVLPAAVRSWCSTHHAVRARLMLDRLYPLWADLVRVTPGIALEPVRPRWRDRLHLGDLDLRLYRRVIEIRDGHLALRHGAEGRTTADLAGRRVAQQLTALSDSHARTGATMPSTVDGEIEWWAEIAVAYEHAARRRRVVKT